MILSTALLIFLVPTGLGLIWMFILCHTREVDKGGVRLV